MVASLDQNFGRYYSAISHHANGEELSNSLTNQLRQAILCFRSENGNKVPSRIILYRDGVGEGDIPYVFNHEVEQLKKMLIEFYPKSKEECVDGHVAAPLTVVVVTKRINTRLFTARGENPDPGTVVDTMITDPLKYDFFIVSQSVKQGTVSPTAYNIIWDKSGLNSTAMQSLAFKFCHMYYNMSNTIRVPAPCQYAHKLALLVTTALNGDPSPALQKTLYFL